MGYGRLWLRRKPDGASEKRVSVFLFFWGTTHKQKNSSITTLAAGRGKYPSHFTTLTYTSSSAQHLTPPPTHHPIPSSCPHSHSPQKPRNIHPQGPPHRRHTYRSQPNKVFRLRYDSNKHPLTQPKPGHKGHTCARERS